VAVEVVAQYLHGFETPHVSIDRFGVPHDQNVELRSVATTLNAKWYPLTGVIQPYGVIGIGGGWFEIERIGSQPGSDTTNEFVFRGGVGVDMRLGSHVTFYGEVTYLGATGEFDGSGAVPVVAGVQYRF
jgi:opacity protein-like surface antigen